MEVPQRFCVRWNSYKTNLQTAFPKLLTSEHFVDVTLACERQYLKCHKVVLSACSVYFEDLLVNNPCQHPIIFMKDIAFWEMKALVEFMYKGEVNVSQEQLDCLLRSAESLQIRGLSGAKRWANDEERETKRRKGSGDDEDGKSLQISSSYEEKEEEETEELVEQEEEPDQSLQIKEESLVECDDSVYLENTDDDSEEYSDGTRKPGPSGVSEFISLEDLGQRVLLQQPVPQTNVKNQLKQLAVKSEPNFKPKNNRPKAKRNMYKQYTLQSMMAALEKIEEGISVYSASIQFGVPRKTLRNWMKKYNILSRFDLRKQMKSQDDVSD